MKKQFIIAADPPNEYAQPAWWFIFYKRKLLVSSEGREPAVPLTRKLADAKQTSGPLNLNPSNLS